MNIPKPAAFLYTKMQDEKEIHQFEEFTITCKEIQVGHARHNNRWTVDNE